MTVYNNISNYKVKNTRRVPVYLFSAYNTFPRPYTGRKNVKSITWPETLLNVGITASVAAD